jgi:hypothetical protein
MSSNHRLFHRGAKIVVACRAVGASHAASREPPETDRLTHLKFWHVVTFGCDYPDSFMAPHKWILGEPHSLLSIERSECQIPRC